MTRLQSYSRRLLCLLPLLLGALVAGCGDSSNDDNLAGPGSGGGVAVAPAVTSTTPADGATDVPTNRKITARFSKDLAAKTLDKTTFTLTAPGIPAVAATVALDAATNTATLTPAAALAADTLFTATVTTAVKDTGGAALASNFVWTFKTGQFTDTKAPTITVTDPLNLATAVPTNRKISATFDEAIDPASITATTFTLTGPGTAPVTGAVNYVGSTAVFSPTNPLAPSTAYTATIKTGVKDLAGNALASNLVWAFTTANAAQALAKGPAPVMLGTASNFVILAKTGVSTTGTTKITGDIGVSPAAETFITGFSQARDASNVFSTAPALVTGKLYAANMAVPTPANMTTAIGNMETAYTDAAGRSLPDTTELGAGNISGQTLAPGLYKWGTGLLLAGGVTLNGGANDVWIFQIAQDLTVGNGAIVTLSGGAQARNIFWQVAGKTTLGTTSDFKGTVLSKTLIALQTGARLNGRALAQTAVTLDANAVTAP
jgi:Ice-binding-like/Bacterial Ig-like domain